MLGLLVSALIGTFAFASQTQQVDLKFDYEKDGVALCSAQKRILLKETHLICETSRGANRVFVKTTVTKESSNLVRVRTGIEEVDPASVVILQSQSEIQTMSGSPGRMTVSDENGVVQMQMSVLATLID